MAKTTRPAAPDLRESSIQGTCTEFLELDGWRALATTPVSNRSRGAGFGEKGMADHLYIRYRNSADPRGPVPYTKSRVYDPLADVLWVEWKRIHRSKATIAKVHQKDWHAIERARGALTLIAGEDFHPTIEGFQEYYFSSGLNRRLIDPRRTEERARPRTV